MKKRRPATQSKIDVSGNLAIDETIPRWERELVAATLERLEADAPADAHDEGRRRAAR